MLEKPVSQWAPYNPSPSSRPAPEATPPQHANTQWHKEKKNIIYQITASEQDPQWNL